MIKFPWSLKMQKHKHMKNNKTNIDPVIKSLLEEAGTEQPSSQFSDKIMHQIHEKSMKSAFVYTPVIGRKAWILMALFAISLVVYLLTAYAGEVQPVESYGYDFHIDTTVFSSLLAKFTSLFASPILKAAILTFVVFTFINQLILYWKSRPMTN